MINTAYYYYYYNTNSNSHRQKKSLCQISDFQSNHCIYKCTGNIVESIPISVANNYFIPNFDFIANRHCIILLILYLILWRSNINMIYFKLTLYQNQA